MKKKLSLVAAATGLFMAPSVFAVSVLDTDMTAAVTTALADLKDTIGDLVGQVLPVVVTVAVMLAVPPIVKRFIRLAGGSS